MEEGIPVGGPNTSSIPRMSPALRGRLPLIDRLSVAVRRGAFRFKKITSLAPWPDVRAIRQDERNRISMDLHDRVMPLLFGVRVAAETCKERVGGERPEVEPILEHMERALAQVVYELRISLFELEGQERERLDLGRALSELVAEGIENRSPERSLFVHGVPRAMPQSICECLLSATREAVLNSERHGRPRSIEVQLRYEGETVCVVVADDGIGFDESALHHPRTRGMGLRNMQKRLELFSGKLGIHSQEGQGTTIWMRVPSGVE